MSKKKTVVGTKITNTVKSVKGKTPGYVYLQQRDGTTKRIPFEDASGNMTLECTQADIDNAVCGDPMNCVMARMFRRAFGPLCSEVRVGKRVMHVVQGRGERANVIRFAVKGKLKKAIHQFDISNGGSGFKAGESYIISPPPPSEVRGARKKGPYGAHNGKGARNRIKGNLAPIRPTRNIVCFTSAQPDPMFPKKGKA